MTIAAIPSPSTAVWHLGPVPIRAYALCIIAGIAVACAVTEYRLRRRGAPRWAVLDVAVWAVPFGIVGARIYHVITSPAQYFGARGDWTKVFAVWEGGLGIWGAVAGGALGAWLGCRQLGIPLTMFADALAPGLPLAQAVGRLGNWFNNELHGGRTDLPWGLEVHRMDSDNPGRALVGPDGQPELLPGLYHPTFAYEALWNVGVALLVLLADRRFRFGRGRAFALYVMGYTAGRFWIEMMRTDEATHLLGMRVNVWVSLLVFLGGLVYFLRVRGPREYLVPAGEPGAAGGGDLRVVTWEQYEAYRSTGALPAPVPHAGDPARDDDGADLADGAPALDDFADDETDDVDEPPATEPDDPGRAGAVDSGGPGRGGAADAGRGASGNAVGGAERGGGGQVTAAGDDR
ncbi:MAG TPA: prolipoprotein diacylglyceryl transferase [Pilimelia sp.]|nr:prolipoprotein diacylglyceryl transferase [Pilimelia sp.]